MHFIINYCVLTRTFDSVRVNILCQKSNIKNFYYAEPHGMLENTNIFDSNRVVFWL